MRQKGSRHSTLGLRARHIYKRSPRRCSPVALNNLARLLAHDGRFDDAAAAIAEADSIADMIRGPRIMYFKMNLFAWRGDADTTSELIAAGTKDAIARGEGMVVTVSEYSK